MWDDLQRGIFIGYAVSIPVGPVALLVIRRSIKAGRAQGIVSGLGAATVDLFCGTAAVIGLKGLTLAIEHHEHLLRLLGGVFLMGFGIHTLKTTSSAEDEEAGASLTLRNAYLSTAALTISNPLTWLGLVFVSAAVGAGSGREAFSAVKTITTSFAICCASASWWFGLSVSAAWLGQKLGTKILHAINIVAGVALLAVGLFQIVDILRHHRL